MLTNDEKANILSCDPFEGDFGDQNDRVFLDRMSVARKQGDCSFCKSPIQPGDEQRRMTARFDGELRSYRWCVSCCLGMAGLDAGDDEDQLTAQQRQGEGGE